MSVLKDLFTGIDGMSHDLGRWSWAGSFAAVLAAGIWNAYHGVALSLTEIAMAFGTVAGAHGAALFMKRDTEPKEPAP